MLNGRINCIRNASENNKEIKEITDDDDDDDDDDEH